MTMQEEVERLRAEVEALHHEARMQGAELQSARHAALKVRTQRTHPQPYGSPWTRCGHLAAATLLYQSSSLQSSLSDFVATPRHA